jgi:hypothetical protein
MVIEGFPKKYGNGEELSSSPPCGHACGVIQAPPYVLSMSITILLSEVLTRAELSDQWNGAIFPISETAAN